MHSISEFRDQRFAEVADPWERFNRSMYRFNYYFDKYLFLPVVSGYEFVTPLSSSNASPASTITSREVRNLTNSLFQLKGKESVTTLGRFVTNSTMGLGGLFDPATRFGLERHEEDFGKTLGYWGLTPGPTWCCRSSAPRRCAIPEGSPWTAASITGSTLRSDPFGNYRQQLRHRLGDNDSWRPSTSRHQQSFPLLRERLSLRILHGPLLLPREA